MGLLLYIYNLFLVWMLRCKSKKLESNFNFKSYKLYYLIRFKNYGLSYNSILFYKKFKFARRFFPQNVGRYLSYNDNVF